MQIFTDLVSFLKTLSFVDYVFFFAVQVLMLLIIILIYFIKENSEEDNFDNFSDNNPKKTEIEYLKELTETLENAKEPEINLNKYEEEQEEKAIISYEELLKRKNDFAINYSEEENIDDDLSIKKVDLDNLLNKDIIVKPEIKVTVLSYEKEEAFLQALKTLQQNLN